MDIAMTVNPADKIITAHEPKIEKNWLLRKTFEDLFTRIRLAGQRTVF